MRIIIRYHGQKAARPPAILERMTPLLAHAGHWLLWVLYLLPVVIVLIATARAFREERRARREQG